MSEKSQPALVKLYLILFNFLSLVSWALLLVNVVRHYLNGGSINELWWNVETVFKVAQTLAVLEVVHPLLGWIRSPFFTTFIQVLSRIGILWFIINLESRTPLPLWGYIALNTLIFAWGVTEVVRYAFYGLKLLNIEFSLLTWCRYSFFLVLYPLGVSSELTLVAARLAYIYSDRPYSLFMPNSINFGIDFFYLVIIALIAYIPGFPTLYGHMRKMRSKVLSSEKTKTA